MSHVRETKGYAIVMPFREMGLENETFVMHDHVRVALEMFPAWKIKGLRRHYMFKKSCPERFERAYAEYIRKKIGMSYTLIVDSVSQAHLLNREVLDILVPSYACARKNHPRFSDYVYMYSDHEAWISRATAIYYKPEDAYDYIQQITSTDH
jgi:hypothetical protein